MRNRDRSGKEFIAYKGTEFSFDRITTELGNRIDDKYNFTVKSECVGDDNIIFAKIVSSSYTRDREPCCMNSLLTVNGYVQEEMEDCVNHFGYGITDPDRAHLLTYGMYRDCGPKMFEKLAEYGMHFSTVVYDERNGNFVAGVSEPSEKYTNLFYGYTKRKREVMFSNVRETLESFCDEIHEMKPNTYMLNGEIYTLDGEKVVDSEKPDLLRKNKENVDALFDGLNALLFQVATESVKAKIEKNIEDYLLSDNPKKRIEDYLLKEIDLETQKKVLELIKKSIEDFNIEQNVRDSLNDLFNKQLEEYSKNVNIPVVHIIKLKDIELGKTSGGFYHEKFEEVLSLVQLDEPIMLIGPAGSGKNHSIGQIAQALGLHMYYTNNASNEFKLTGFIDAGGNYRDTEFYKAFKNGGIFFLDEIDNSDPSALIVINSALANGYMAFPHETIDRHPDFRMVAAANTWGKGSDLQYVGRNALDGATLDRFDNVFFDYDRKLEAALYPNDEVLKFMWSLRDATEETKTPHIVSTRGIGKVYKKEINGIPVETILRTNVIRNLGQDDLNTLLGSMRNINDGNKYYSAAKTLRLGR